MKREVAQALSPITSSRFFQLAMKAYVEDKLEVYNSRILVAKDFETVKELVGRIQELKELLTLSERVDSSKGQ